MAPSCSLRLASARAQFAHLFLRSFSGTHYVFGDQENSCHRNLCFLGLVSFHLKTKLIGILMLKVKESSLTYSPTVLHPSEMELFQISAMAANVPLWKLCKDGKLTEVCTIQHTTSALSSL